MLTWGGLHALLLGVGQAPLGGGFGAMRAIHEHWFVVVEKILPPVVYGESSQISGLIRVFQIPC